MNTRSLINQLCDCAEKYNRRLLDRDFLYICEPLHFEASFRAGHYKHLTGVELPGEKRRDGTTVPLSYDGQHRLSKQAFFAKCLARTLTEHDFGVPTGGWVELKLRALSPLCLNSPEKMGMFNDLIVNKLRADYVAGLSMAYLGFKRGKKSRYCFPCTVVTKNLEDIVAQPKTIVLVLGKLKNESKYTQICYQKRGYNLQEILKKQKLEKLLEDEIIGQCGTH